MEQIIIFVILAIVSAFFKKGKEKTDTPAKGQAKPFTATGRIPDSPQKKLKDMSKDLYRELQKEMQRTDGEPPSRQLQQPVAPKPIVAAQPVAPPVTATPARSTTPRASAERKERTDSTRGHQRHSGRLSAHGAQYQMSTMQTNEFVPKNKEDLVKGIIFSEILGPPKSKR
ncbi:hypothetical protein [Sporosarcina sp. NPDC096371]|uniref:hypothetical protein n=1 Tax=Sporosarcina sp. NPDC096371 TaxID=3364530 RepID=UPI00381154B4